VDSFVKDQASGCMRGWGQLKEKVSSALVLSLDTPHSLHHSCACQSEIGSVLSPELRCPLGLHEP